MNNRKKVDKERIARVANELTLLKMAITSSREDKAPYDNSTSTPKLEDADLGSESEILNS